MQDLHKALADIGSIRQQIAAGTMFRGFGPAVVATTGPAGRRHRHRPVALARRSGPPAVAVPRRLGRHGGRERRA